MQKNRHIKTDRLNKIHIARSCSHAFFVFGRNVLYTLKFNNKDASCLQHNFDYVVFLFIAVKALISVFDDGVRHRFP